MKEPWWVYVFMKNDITGTIFDIKRYAIHDGPGIRTTVFLKGCPLRCVWCHNPESWRMTPEPSFRESRCLHCGRCTATCEHQAIALNNGGPVTTDLASCMTCGTCVDSCPGGAREVMGRIVSVGEVIAEIERDVIFYDESDGGATFSGGEPLLQFDFLQAALRECREREIHTAVDTTCFAAWETIKAIADETDLFLCDLKHMDEANHRKLTGVSNVDILENIKRLTKLGKDVVVRFPVIPTLNDDDENVEATGRYIREVDGISRVDLLPFNDAAEGKLARLSDVDDYEPFTVEPPTAERMNQIADRLKDLGLNVLVGG